jgi:hypothetical protein
MRSPLPDIVRLAIVPAVVILAMVLFKRLFPAGRGSHKIGKEQLSELDERFSPLRGRVIGGMIAVGLLLLFGSWFILCWTNRFLARADGPALYQFLPQTAIWWFFPGLGAVALCWELTLQIWSLFGDRATVDLFSDWTNQSNVFWGRASYVGMDSRKALRWLALLIVVPIGIFTVLALNMHASVGPDVIRDCGYAFRPCSVYALSDVRRITQIDGFRTTDGKLTRRAGVVLDFKDGRRWSSADWGNFRDSVDPALTAFLKTKTGLPLNFAETEDDIPQLDGSVPVNSN